LETEPQLIEQYIKTGRARLIYRHLFQLGDGSRALAEASECAGAQGKFWEMRELIYTEQAQLYRATEYSVIAPLVRQLGLDEARFAQCFTSGEFRQQVAEDAAAAEREGVLSRPVLDVNSTRLIGALPLSRYVRAIDAAR
jgi:protein-disulfide isomerase